MWLPKFVRDRIEMWREKLRMEGRKQATDEINKQLTADWPPPALGPTFGFATHAKDKPGVPDLDLAQNVSQLLYGTTDPMKRVARVTVVVRRVDGTEDEVYSTTDVRAFDIERDLIEDSVRIYRSWGPATLKQIVVERVNDPVPVVTMTTKEQ